MSALREMVAIVHNGDAYHIYLEPQDHIVVMDRIIRFSNNQNVTGQEEDFFTLDRSTRRAIIRAVTKTFKKSVLPKTNV